MLTEFFTKNLDIIFFVYGLSFVVMGIAIMVFPRRDSMFKLSRIIWLLAGFGLSHGLNEWLDMFAIIKWKGSEAFNLLRLALLIISYIFFFEFGRRFIILSFKKFLNKWGTITICFMTFVFMFLVKKEPGIWPRYFLGLPGGLFSAFGFILYYRNNRAVLRPLGVRRYFLTAGVLIASYAILGGLVVPKADFFPASLINNASFLNTVGVPVQVFRAICAVLLAWCTWNILGIFAWELNEKLKANLEEITKAKDYAGNIISSISDVLIVVGPNSKIKIVNESAAGLLGYSEQEITRMTLEDIFLDRPVEEILNEIEEAAILVSKDFKIIAANNNFFKAVGLGKKDVINQYCYKITHNIGQVCQPPKDRCPIQEVNEKKRPHTEWHSHIDKEGKEYLVSVTAAPIRDVYGKIIYYLHLAKNIEKGRGQEKELSQDWEAVKFYTQALEKRRFFVRSDFADYIRNLKVVRGLDIYCKTKAAEKVPVSLSASVMRGKKGEFLGLVCVIKDMREIKRLMQQEKEVVIAKTEAEAERRKAGEIGRLYNELERSHLELKSTQSQLIQAEKMAVVGELASGVAHEVKNPLAIILQGVEYFSRIITSKEENASSVLKYMDEAVKRADKIVKGLLSLSRLPDIDAKEENLNSVIDNVLVLMKHQLDERRVRLIRDFKPDLPLVKIDKNKIEQVFVNLVLNAAQAMPEGGELKVKTYTEGETPRQIWAVAQIEDTGKGIPEDALGKIFDPFFTTKRNTGGTGLGLSVVKNIIETHGGGIKIENRKEAPGAIATVKFKAG